MRLAGGKTAEARREAESARALAALEALRPVAVGLDRSLSFERDPWRP